MTIRIDENTACVFTKEIITAGITDRYFDRVYSCLRLQRRRFHHINLYVTGSTPACKIESVAGSGDELLDVFLKAVRVL